MTELIILLVVLVAALAVGLFVRARAGKVRDVRPDGAAPARRAELLTEVGVAPGVPTVLHFSADWCGPCAAVRRVVGSAIADLSTSASPPVEVELDIDRHPVIAKELGVLSLPTTFIFDADLTERFRISGVPAANDLRSALAPLTV
ncbi:thioredoxin family protein [Aldersonia sp. NBC_00410]|uniref:thioredoxin family protein n=1 Tax=Aldersonia sp. NBC_00410 TaxID=2975954 RepID=UPI0022561DDE|nr:thioredoxin family protein [Aldersonia sp. NBC_00410]MCX5043449.1 thioredoxin family protein [Aldersonia sp. NBC_00410]